MSMKVLVLSMSGILMASLAGCQGNTDVPVAPLAGAAVGGVVGSQFGGGGFGTTLATIAGTVAGAVLGDRLTEEQQTAAARAERQAVTSNTPSSWTASNGQARGEVRPIRTFTGPDGQQCRTYVHRVELPGETDNLTGTACRQSDGTWELVDV